MKLVATFAAAFLALGTTVAFAQATPDGATAGEKPGQGTNTGAMKDGMMMKDGKMVPKDGATNGTSTGTGEAAMPDKPSMAPTPPNSGKGVPDTK